MLDAVAGSPGSTLARDVSIRFVRSNIGSDRWKAAEQTESEYLAVFDADERVHEPIIRRAVALLDEYDIVQGRTIPEPRGPIEEMAYYESVLLSYVSRRLLYLLTRFRMASSRAVVMRRQASSVSGATIRISSPRASSSPTGVMSTESTSGNCSGFPLPSRGYMACGTGGASANDG